MIEYSGKQLNTYTYAGSETRTGAGSTGRWLKLPDRGVEVGNPLLLWNGSFTRTHFRAIPGFACFFDDFRVLSAINPFAFT